MCYRIISLTYGDHHWYLWKLIHLSLDICIRCDKYVQVCFQNFWIFKSIMTIIVWAEFVFYTSYTHIQPDYAFKITKISLLIILFTHIK